MKKQAVLEKEVEILSDKEMLTENKKKLLRQAAFAVLGILTAMFQKDYGISPFAPALVAVSPRDAVFLSFLGGAVGYMLNLGLKDSLGLICVLFTASIGKIICDKRFHSLDSSTVSAVFASLFLVCFRVISMIYGAFAPEKILLYSAEAVLCLCFSYFFRRAVKIMPCVFAKCEISKTDASCLCVSAAAVVCCAGGINISVIHPVHIPVCMAVLFFAYYGGTACGSVAGIISGAALSLGVTQPFLFAAYSVGGLAAGVFSSLGQYASAIALAVSSGASLLFFMRDKSGIAFLAECAVACIGFTFIPAGSLDSLTEKLKGRGKRNDNETNMQVALSLRSAADAVGEINGIITSASERVNEIVNPEMTKLYARIQHRVCSDCKNNRICWDSEFEGTVRDIGELAMRMSGKTAPVGLSGETAKRCIRPSELSREVDSSRREYINSIDSRVKAEELRNVVSDQFTSIACLLEDISVQITQSRRYDDSKTRAVKNALLDNGIRPHSVACRENLYRRGTVEIKLFEERDRVEPEKIRKIISTALKKQFRDAEVAVEDFFTVLMYYQKPEYEIINGIAQIPCGNNTVCGDCARTSDDSCGNFIAVISDGMGTGRKAYIDGSMTAVIMHKLISSGFTFDNALSLVNSALLVKSNDESMATVDAMRINTFSGECVFCKAGAAASFIRHGDTVHRTECESLPVGILRSVELAKEITELKRGDIVLMMSDGAEQAGLDTIEDALLSWSTDNMQELAMHIASLARLKGQKSFPDDITVIAAKVKKSR